MLKPTFSSSPRTTSDSRTSAVRSTGTCASSRTGSGSRSPREETCSRCSGEPAPVRAASDDHPQAVRLDRRGVADRAERVHLALQESEIEECLGPDSGEGRIGEGPARGGSGTRAQPGQVSARGPHPRRQLRHRAGRHRQDVSCGGVRGGSPGSRPGHPYRAGAPGGGGRASGWGSSPATSSRRSIPTSAPCSTRSTRCSATSARRS